MQEIILYCRKCRKSMRIGYAPCGNDDAPAMNGIVIRCNTRKCKRAVILKNYTEGRIKAGADSMGRCYL